MIGSIDGTIAIIVTALTILMPILLFVGWRRLRTAQGLPYFTLRQRRVREGWRLILLGFGIGLLGLVTRLYGPRAVEIVVTLTPSSTPLPSATPTATITLTPSVTATASTTPTASITPSPSATPSPEIPEALTVLFRETVTARPEAVFSEIAISRRLDTLNRAAEAAEAFENPIETLYGAFTYDFLDDGVRWTAIWYRDGEIICSETKPWDGGTGGYGFTECRPQDGWLPGNYEVQMFIGEAWIVSGRFAVRGLPATVIPSPTP